MTFIHPCRLGFVCTHMQTDTSYPAKSTRTIALIPANLSNSVSAIHHQALNMQIILISVLGVSITHSNVPLYLNLFLFIFISLFQDRPRSFINTGTHADRWSQASVIGWTSCHSSLVYIFCCAERGDAGLRNNHTVPHHTDIHHIHTQTLTHCSQQCAHVSLVSERGKVGTLGLFISEHMYLRRPGGRCTEREGQMRKRKRVFGQSIRFKCYSHHHQLS